MSAGFSIAVDVILMLTMAGLGGLVYVLHMKLKEFGRDAMRVPALADDLTTAITTSRTAMQELAQAARTDGARLENLTSRAAGCTQELTYLIGRAEKVLERFDALSDRGLLRNDTFSAQPKTTTETIAPAAQTTAPTATPVTAQRPLVDRRASSQAAIMPGRYKKEMATPQPAEKPYKPASFGSTAAAYNTANNITKTGAATGNTETLNNDTPPVASEAELELRRALGGGIA